MLFFFPTTPLRQHRRFSCSTPAVNDNKTRSRSSSSMLLLSLSSFLLTLLLQLLLLTSRPTFCSSSPEPVAEPQTFNNNSDYDDSISNNGAQQSRSYNNNNNNSSQRRQHDNNGQMRRFRDDEKNGILKRKKPESLPCGPAPIVENAVIDEASFDEDALFGDYVWYRCARGYQMLANAGISCNNGGQWHPRLPFCVIQQQPTNPSNHHSPTTQQETSAVENIDERCLVSWRFIDAFLLMTAASSSYSEIGRYDDGCVLEEIRWRFDTTSQRCSAFFDCVGVRPGFVYGELSYLRQNSFSSRRECFETCLRLLPTTKKPIFDQKEDFASNRTSLIVSSSNALTQFENETATTAAVTTTTGTTSASTAKEKAMKETYNRRLPFWPSVTLTTKPPTHYVTDKLGKQYLRLKKTTKQHRQTIAFTLYSSKATNSTTLPTPSQQPFLNYSSTNVVNIKAKSIQKQETWEITTTVIQTTRRHQKQHLRLSGGLRGPHCLPGFSTQSNHSSCLDDSQLLVDTVPFPIDEPLKLHYLWLKIARQSGLSITKLSSSVIDVQNIALIWNEELAITAERHASQCLEDHDEVWQRTVPTLGLNETTGVGQNICWSSWDDSLYQCIYEWALRQRRSAWPTDEGADIIAAFKAINDTSLFTDLPNVPSLSDDEANVMSPNKLYIGCGKAHCRPLNAEWDFTIVCNYGPNKNNIFVPSRSASSEAKRTSDDDNSDYYSDYFIYSRNNNNNNSLPNG